MQALKLEMRNEMEKKEKREIKKKEEKIQLSNEKRKTTTHYTHCA